MEEVTKNIIQNFRILQTFAKKGIINKEKSLQNIVQKISTLVLQLTFLNISVLTSPGCRELEVTPVPLSFSANPCEVIMLHSFELAYTYQTEGSFKFSTVKLLAIAINELINIILLGADFFRISKISSALITRS